jgi:hypothetical protein
MLAGLKKLVAFLEPAPRHRHVELLLTADGFALVRKGVVQFEVRWSDVREAFAFKRDLLTVDLICLGFRVSDGGSFYEVDEDMPGYEALCEEIGRHFPAIKQDWWCAVTFPAFATNRTTIWGERMPW